MRRPTPWLLLTMLLAATPPVHALDEPLVRLSEIVADPQTDWTGDGRITASDEYVELHNAGAADVDLTGWILRLADSTPADTALSGTLVAGGRRLVQNPSGDTNNDGHALLLDAQGRVRDEVRYGAWPQADAPTANANGVLDESLRRLDAWTRGPATPDRPNDALGWRLSSTLRPAGGWVGPNTTATFTATALADSSDPLRRLELFVDEVPLYAIAGADVQVLNGNHTLRLGETDAHLAWRAERRSGTETMAWTVAIDAVPPLLQLPNTTVWRNRTASLVDVARAEDAGVGGVQYQWRVNGNVHDWDNASSLRIDADQTSAAVRARDAFNNTGPWSAEVDLRIDDESPQILALTATAPDRLDWTVAENGSGLAGFELVRRADGAQSMTRLDAQARNHTDPFPITTRATYELVPIDQVGNRGPAATVNLTTDLAKPVVRGIRFSKNIWSSGALEIRIDFDRPMDPSTQPDVRFSSSLELREARFLANRSTFYLAAASPPPGPDGPFLVTVLAARSAEGDPLRTTAIAGILVDATGPLLDASPAAGATNSSHLELTARDGSPLRVAWRLFRVGSTKVIAEGESGANTRIEFPADGHWRIRATATDAAGHRSAEWSGLYDVDRSRPELRQENATMAGLLEVRADDATSGIDWASLTLSHPAWRASVDAPRGRILIQPDEAAANATLTVQDRAGNTAQVLLWRASSAAPPPESQAIVLDVDDAGEPPASHARPKGFLWPSAAAFVGGIAAAIPLRRSHARRRARKRSFGRRLRAVLAESGPSDAVKDASAG
jgi:hypothetical protein